MSEHIIWRIEARIREEQDELFKQVMKDLIDAANREDGTLDYEWFISKDGRRIETYERYESTEAALDHLKSWQKHAFTFFLAAEITQFKVYSELIDELHEAVVGEGTQFMVPLAGFTR